MTGSARRFRAEESWKIQALLKREQIFIIWEEDYSFGSSRKKCLTQSHLDFFMQNFPILWMLAINSNWLWFLPECSWVGLLKTNKQTDVRGKIYHDRRHYIYVSVYRESSVQFSRSVVSDRFLLVLYNLLWRSNTTCIYKLVIICWSKQIITNL